MNELILAYQFLNNILAPDATLATYAPGGLRRTIAPPLTLAPFVMMTHQSPGEDTLTITANRVLVRPLFQIRAVGRDSDIVNTQLAANRIEVLLGGPDGLRNQSITGGFIAACYRENALADDENAEGEVWTSLGGLYRLELYSTG